VLGIFEIGAHELFAKAGFNPPDFCLLNSQDYRCESLAPGSTILHIGKIVLLTLIPMMSNKIYPT
jgi:hypothetical protein